MQSNRQEGKHDEQLRELVVEAERALARRELALATQLLAKAETITPEHPLILNARGMQKLHEGQLQAAKELAERAVARDATNPAFWINLATIQRALTAPEAEMQALERALALEPRHLLALLQKATCNDVSKLEDGRAQYNGLLYPTAGFVDDILVYRMAGDDYFVVVNAANSDKDYEWLVECAKGMDVAVTNASVTFEVGPKPNQMIPAPIESENVAGNPSLIWVTTFVPS